MGGKDRVLKMRRTLGRKNRKHRYEQELPLTRAQNKLVPTLFPTSSNLGLVSPDGLS
jgi:hypothetical protein